MALKALLLRKKIDSLKNGLKKLDPQAEEIRSKLEKLQQREAELEAAINEMTEENTEEEKAAVNEEVEALEADKAAADKEQEDLDAEKKRIEDEIVATEQELSAIEEKQAEKPAQNPAPATDDEEKPAERKGGVKQMSLIRKIFRDMDVAQRNALISTEAVQGWLGEIRSAIREKRAITGVGLTIPEVLLPLLRDRTATASKLYKHVNVQSVSGEARQPIMGAIDEGVWTECCANLNELALAFNDWTVDCFKCAGYYALCKANVEDSDVDLVAIVIDALGKSLGKGYDKAMLYGRNTADNQNMPYGIVTRLLETSQPAGYPSTARAWEDLHTSHVLSEGTALSPITGLALIQALVKDSAVASSDYSEGGLTWVMNKKTAKSIVAETLSVNAAGAVAAAIGNTMPIVGGAIEEIDFLPDDVIIFGYFDNYLFAERAGAEFASSEHVRFLQDQIVYKGTARADGAPVIAEAFGIIALNGASVAATDVTFPQDTANQAKTIAINKPAVTVTVATGTAHTAKLVATTNPDGMPVTWTSSNTGVLTVSTAGVVTAVASGTATVTAASGVANAFCTVTVTD